MNLNERQKVLKKYLKEAKNSKDAKVSVLFRKYSRKLERKFPEWYVACNFARVLLHKRCVIGVEKHYVAIAYKYNFEIDIRENWKKQIKSAFKTVEDYLLRS